jgi:hypothetical protein
MRYRDDAPWQAIRAFVRLLVAAPLLLGSVLLAFQPAVIRSFARTGLPDGVRILLAAAEITASILFMLPRTVYLGGCGLLAVLVAAMGLHATLHLGVGLQPLYLVLVAALLWVEYRVRSTARKRPAAGVAMGSGRAGK